MRAALVWLVFAGAAFAQDPPFDTTGLETCVKNAETMLDSEACIGMAAQSCMDTPGGETTAGMSLCLGDEFKFWDERLNVAYKALMQQHKTEDAQLAGEGFQGPGMAGALRDMQRAWMAYRDAACAYEFALWGGGSGGGPAATGCRMQITAQQALALEMRVDDMENR